MTTDMWLTTFIVVVQAMSGGVSAYWAYRAGKHEGYDKGYVEGHEKGKNYEAVRREMIEASKIQ